MISSLTCVSDPNQIQDLLYQNQSSNDIIPENVPDVLNQSAVLFPIGCGANGTDKTDDISLILNKRSKKVRQAGDLCCPGGGVSSGVDRLLGRLLNFPLSSLSRWKYWSGYREKSPEEARKLAILFAASLRESFEEMKLNPFKVRFLGALPPKQLVIRNRFIFPMVGWVHRQKKFFPNWEVDEIVHIPFKNLLNADNYAICQLSLNGAKDTPAGMLPPRHPGYFHKTQDGEQLLWGATYRIVMDFLYLVFGFTPPTAENVPVVKWELDEHYFNGLPT